MHTQRQWERARLLAAVALLALCPRVRGDEGARYSLAQCLEIGLERSAAILNAHRDVATGDAIIGQARSDAFPHLRVVGEYRRLDSVESIDFGASSVDLGILNNYNVQAEVSQTLYSGGRTVSALRAARLARERYEWTYAITRAGLQHDIRRRFHALLLARRVAEVREASLAQLTAHADEAKQKHTAGTVSEYDSLSAQVRVVNEKPAVIAANNQIRLARIALQRVLNLEDEVFDIEGELRLVPVRETLANLLVRCVDRRPELQEMETMVLLREQDVRVSRAGGVPSIRTYFNYNGANSYQFAGFEEDWQWHWNAGVVAEWDIWNGGLTASEVRQKQLVLEQTRTSLGDMAMAVRLEVRRAYLDMERALAAVDAGQGGVDLAERALRIAETAYQSGLATSLEYSDSQLALSTARLTRLQALHDHMNAVADLEFACGLEPGTLAAEGVKR